MTNRTSLIATNHNRLKSITASDLKIAGRNPFCSRLCVCVFMMSLTKIGKSQY